MSCRVSGNAYCGAALFPQAFGVVVSVHKAQVEDVGIYTKMRYLFFICIYIFAVLWNTFVTSCAKSGYR